MMTMLRNLWKDEEGAAAAEYVLVLGLAALAIVIGATQLGTAMNNAFTTSATAVGAANP